MNLLPAGTKYKWRNTKEHHIKDQRLTKYIFTIKHVNTSIKEYVTNNPISGNDDFVSFKWFHKRISEGSVILLGRNGLERAIKRVNKNENL